MKQLTSLDPEIAPLQLGDDPKVGILVSGGLLTCSPDLSLKDVAKRMNRAKVSCILVVKDDQLLGIWTEGDTRKLDFSKENLLATPIHNLMSSPVVSVNYDARLSETAIFMKERRLRRLLVLNPQGEPLGMLTQSDLVRYQGVENYLLMRNVGSSISRLPLRLYASLTITEAVMRLREAGVEAAIVEHGHNKPISIITERDLISLLAEEVNALTLQELATHTLFCVPKDMSLMHAVDLLREKGFRHLGVVECDADGNPTEELCGLLSFTDILSSIEYEYVNQLRGALEARDLALKTSTEHLILAQKVIEASLDGIIITNNKGIIQTVNPSFTTLTGYSADEVIGQTPAMLSSGRHDKEFYQSMWKSMLVQGYWQGEVWNRRKNGEVYAEWLTITGIRNSQGVIRQFAAIFSDITDRKLKEEQIHSMAYYDELTGLANRRLLLDRLKQALANAHYHKHKMGVLFLDLDLFKRINDSLGHQAGDEVLQKIARRLESSVREGDSVARLGGDEFLVLVPEVESLPLLEALAARLISVLTKPLVIQQNHLVISTSIGISVFPDDGETPEVLLKHADTAMYRAKETGRNSYCFYNSQMGERSYADLALEHRLRIALNDHSLYLVYQPKIDVGNHQWVGMEALLRWDDAVLGSVSPAEFIPLAEKLGLIEELGDKVVEQTCKQLQAWLAAGLQPPTISVNVSARQLLDTSFAKRVFKLLAIHQIPANLIELELTESCLIIGDENDQYQLLKQFEAGGIKLSIDDFGTGYSSLSYLRKLPLSTIKIDASFVAELPRNNEDVQLVKAIIGMASALGMDVVAEGVETSAQATLLYGLGCSVCQGYWLARPAKVEQVTRWLAATTEGKWPHFPNEWQPLIFRH
ncbi:MAG TPA: EAL domain-containing protein [Marinospirillum sp.]|uniref:EAL domain-containing protein n=1 Tax=Marinospirillum sp. TaxID=2183934 RepID=UPI002B46C46F|nr:EAL domain-containing protein [Marinospirillum sp.]HKM15575.1 EAL domain-containing protein [Marinospirillum sp.]